MRFLYLWRGGRERRLSPTDTAIQVTDAAQEQMKASLVAVQKAVAARELARTSGLGGLSTKEPRDG